MMPLMKHRGWPTLIVILIPHMVVVEAASSPEASSHVKPPGASHETWAEGIFERERRRSGGVLVKDLMRLAEGKHPNSTVAQANQRLWESSEKGRCDEIWLQVARNSTPSAV
jgi:hypothetical protein